MTGQDCVNLDVFPVQNKDLKQMAHLRKKVAGHKLDYDCKKRHGTQGTEMVESEKKFADSYKVFQSVLTLTGL